MTEHSTARTPPVPSIPNTRDIARNHHADTPTDKNSIPDPNPREQICREQCRHHTQAHDARAKNITKRKHLGARLTTHKISL